MSKSTRKRQPRKGSDRPPKPYPDFPLGPHPGRTPRVKKTGNGLTIKDLCNRFLTAKLRKRKAGEITQPTFNDYRGVTDLLISQFGKERLVDDLAADDFEQLRDHMAEGLGPVRLGNTIGRVKSVFKYGHEAGIINQPMRFGPEFKKPSAAVLRRHKAKNGEKMLQVDQLRQLLDAAPLPLKAMLLLGINCGFIAKDCADLPLSALDLEGGGRNSCPERSGQTGCH